MFEPGNSYKSIFFSGAGYYLPFHLGVVKCFKDFKIGFEKTYGISSGSLAALCMLGGADLDLTIRQIFDLSKNVVFFTWNYTFNVFLAYFEMSRINNKLPLDKINENLNIGLMELKGFKKYFKNKFISEEDLKYSMVLSANVTPFINLLPKSYKNGWYVDPLMVDPGIEGHVFDIAVTPFNFRFHLPNAKITLNGNANILKVLIANENKMKQLFYDGYLKAKATIQPSFSIQDNIFTINACDPKIILGEIQEKKKNWKRETGYIYKKKTKKGKFQEVEVVFADNKWDSFLLMMKKKKLLRVVFLMIIALLLYWCLFY